MKKKEDKKKDLEALRQDLERREEPVCHRLREDASDQDFELRKAVRGAGGHYRVVKNNLADKAVEGRRPGRC